jgi:hypothetical protein
VRIDAGVEVGDDIGIAYDPMIAKVVAYAEDRAHALELLGAALAETEIEGVTTNLPFLRWLLAHTVIRAGEATTAFLTENPPLSPMPLVRPPATFRSPWRLNLPVPPSAPPPDLETESQRPSTSSGGARSPRPCRGP